MVVWVCVVCSYASLFLFFESRVRTRAVSRATDLWISRTHKHQGGLSSKSASQDGARRVASDSPLTIREREKKHPIPQDC